VAASEVIAFLPGEFPDGPERQAREHRGRLPPRLNTDHGSATCTPRRDAVLLKDALEANLVQTLESNPAPITGGRAGNIAHGCNSVLATRTALSSPISVITEAGFGADLGAEQIPSTSSAAIRA